MRGKECAIPYPEKEVAKWKTMAELLHGERVGGGKSGESDSMMMTNPLTYMMAPPTLSTTTIRSEGVEVWDMTGRVGATVSVMECASAMVRKNVDNVWNILLSLSPSRILLSSPLPPADRMEVGYGVFINLGDSTDEEKSLALRYLAPELGNGDELSGLRAAEKEKAVVFALGLVMWEVMTGEAPFTSEVDVMAHKKIQKGELPSLEEIDDEEIRDVVKRMLLRNPAKRPTLMNAAKMLRERLNDADSDDEEESDDQYL